MSKNKNVLGLVMLLSRRSLSLDSIAALYDVSYRTASRYIDSIRNSDIPLIAHKARVAQPVRYKVPLMEKPQDKDHHLNQSWRELVIRHGFKKQAVVVSCDSCKIEKKITPIPHNRPECDRCNRPVVIDRFVL